MDTLPRTPRMSQVFEEHCNGLLISYPRSLGFTILVMAEHHQNCTNSGADKGGDCAVPAASLCWNLCDRRITDIWRAGPHDSSVQSLDRCISPRGGPALSKIAVPLLCSLRGLDRSLSTSGAQYSPGLHSLSIVCCKRLPNCTTMPPRRRQNS